jgi:hypothetical protein
MTAAAGAEPTEGARPPRPTLANFEPCGECADCQAGISDSACWAAHYQAAITAALEPYTWRRRSR